MLRQAFPLWGKVARNAPDEGEMSGRLQRAAYMPPLQTEPQHCNCRKTAGGACPPLLRNIFYCPVGRGDPTPPGKLVVIANFPLISHLR